MRRFRYEQVAGLAFAVTLAGCTVHHSKQALWTPQQSPPAPDSTFVTEEDSGLSLFGLLEVAEPDHYAVLLERIRRRYSCQRMHHPQLDFFTDHWLLVAFPIARVTVVCESAAPPAAHAVDEGPRHGGAPRRDRLAPAPGASSDAAPRRAPAGDTAADDGPLPDDSEVGDQP